MMDNAIKIKRGQRWQSKDFRVVIKLTGRKQELWKGVNVKSKATHSLYERTLLKFYELMS